MLPFDPIKGVDQQISNQLTEFGFHCPVASTAGYWSSHDAPVWRYLATNVFEELQPYPWMRAFHGSDLILLFANEYEFRYEDLGPTVKEAGRYLRNAVAAFVRDPKNGLSTFGWPRYTGEGNTLVKLFENRTAGATFSDPREYDGSCNAVPQ